MEKKEHNQSTQNTNPTFRLLFTSHLLRFLLSFFAFFRFGDYDPRSFEGVQDDLEQPIAAELPDGVPPGSLGFRVLKSVLRIVLRIALPVGSPSM